MDDEARNIMFRHPQAQGGLIRHRTSVRWAKALLRRAHPSFSSTQSQQNPERLVGSLRSAHPAFSRFPGVQLHIWGSRSIPAQSGCAS